EIAIWNCKDILHLVANLSHDRAKQVSSALCVPLESLQAILRTSRDRADSFNDDLVEFSFRNCNEFLLCLERFLREPVVDPDDDGFLVALESQRSGLLDATNIVILAMGVKFEHVERLHFLDRDIAKTQLQMLKLGFDSISTMLFESAGAIFYDARGGHTNDETFIVGEVDMLDLLSSNWPTPPTELISPNLPTTRTVCPKASFPRNMTREKRIQRIRLNCLCDKTEGSHDNLLEYEVTPYTYLVENVYDRTWQCEKLRELWELLTLQLSSRMSKVSKMPSKEAVTADITVFLDSTEKTPSKVEVETSHGRMPLEGKPTIMRLYHYSQSVEPLCEWIPSSTFKLMLFRPSNEAVSVDDDDVLTVTVSDVEFTASKESSIVRESGRMGTLGVTLKDVHVDQNQVTLPKANVKLQFGSIHCAAIFAAQFEAFRNRLLQIWAQRPFGDEVEVYKREYDGAPGHYAEDAQLRVVVVSGPPKSNQSNLRMIMAKKGVPKWLCIDFEDKALKVVKRGLLESLDLVRLWMVEEDDKGKLLVYQTNWKKMMAQAVETRRITRVANTGGTQLIREQQQTSDEWEDRIESVKMALEASDTVKGTYKRVKVCVIDTGFDPKNKNKSRIVSYKDFAEPNRTDMCDLTHHGTFSANLILSIYDECELYVARVFTTSNTDEVKEPELMAKAKWAIDSPQNVDIISISAGFSKHSPTVESAVQKASCANKLVFAAAANWGNKDLVAFPARHALHTICIFATDVIAKASSFNPEGRERAHNFAVLGEGFPDPKDARRRLKGTSMATAAAAGIAAFVVDFSRHGDNRASIIRAADVGRMAGMIAVFEAISRPCGGYKCVSLSNLLPSNFEALSWRAGELRTYARLAISRAMDRAM
ncbi:putative subtilisin-like protease, partial [Ophiocordyceps camponoti-saundersi (nom. inval.)]